MTIYTPNDAFTAAEIVDLSDLVQGGISGDANVPLKALADQSLYLFNRRRRYDDVKIITGAYAFDAVNDLRKLITFNISDNTIFTLPDVTALPIGTIITIIAKISAIKALTVECTGAQFIYDGSNNVRNMYMHDAERLKLVAADDHWEVELAQGNFYTAGMDIYAYDILKNSIIKQGQIFNRQDMPRISAFVVKLQSDYSGSVVPDSVWLTGVNNQGSFSTGNTVSTYRLPDERGTFTRGLDLGRGFDTGRIGNYPGGYEADSVGPVTIPGNAGKGPATWVNENSFSAADNSGGTGAFTITVNGSKQTQPRNIAKLPLILY